MLRTLLKIGVAAAVCVAVLVLAGYWWRCKTYPYGWSHCCDKGLSLGLLTYAQKNAGRFPAGESSPEASLSLLYREGYDVSANLFRGKTIPESVVQEVLDRGELLGPETCGWHYVEGLTLGDDHRLALFWDKAGLGHNGEVLSGGGHIVTFVHSGSEHIQEADWPEFLQEQEALLAARGEAATKGIPLLAARVRLPSGEIVDRFDAPFALRYVSSSESGSGQGTRQGMQLSPESLRWWTLADFGLGGVKDGTLTLTSRLGDWQSEAVTLTLSGGHLSSSTIVLDMKSE